MLCLVFQMLKTIKRGRPKYYPSITVIADPEMMYLLRPPSSWNRDERNRWFVQNDRLLLKATRTYRNNIFIEADDFMQIARMAALRCMDKFNYDLGTSFNTYVVTAVKTEINKNLRDLKARKRKSPLPIASLDSVSAEIDYEDLHSLEFKHIDPEQGEALSLHDIIEYEEGINYVLFILKNKLSLEDQLYAGCLFNAKFQKELASEMGISQTKVSIGVRTVREKIKEELFFAGLCR